MFVARKLTVLTRGISKTLIPAKYFVIFTSWW